VRTPSVVDLWLPSTYFYVAFLTRIGFTFRLFRKIAEIDSQLAVSFRPYGTTALPLDGFP